MLQLLHTLPKELFWSAPGGADSEFTLDDPLALDYLAQQVGLWLFNGFTTRTSRAQYYAVVLYGLRLVDRAIRIHEYPGDDDTRTQLFQRWERFWALATVEFRRNEIDRGDVDAMRGVRGAKKAWSPGDRPLNLDFELISRQNELGGLGAYLSSLRTYGFVYPGTLKVSSSADKILNAFWGESGQHDTQARYEKYALVALDLNKTSIERTHGQITLAGIGKRSRLSSICYRADQQERLWEALFLNAKDGTTLPLAKEIIAAAREGVIEPERLLNGMQKEQWKALTDGLSNTVNIALAFGRLSPILLSCFNRAYDYVNRHGPLVDVTEVAQCAFPERETKKLRTAIRRLLNATVASRFKQLPFYGTEFLNLLNQLLQADPVECFRSVLRYQLIVQRSRRGGGAWLREDNDWVTMSVAGYSGHKKPATFPALKLDVVRRLLQDLGKLQ